MALIPRGRSFGKAKCPFCGGWVQLKSTRVDTVGFSCPGDVRPGVKCGGRGFNLRDAALAMIEDNGEQNDENISETSEADTSAGGDAVEPAAAAGDDAADSGKGKRRGLFG